MEGVMGTCLKAIAEDDAKEFELVLHRVKQLVIKVRKVNLADVKWIQDIPLLCTLYNNPRFIKKVRETLKHFYSFRPSSSLGNDLNVTDLARALNFKKCTENLLNLYSKSKEDVEYIPVAADFSIFIGILNVGKLYGLDPNIIVQNFNNLVSNGLDICARGPAGRTVLHEAVLKMSSPSIYRTIFSLGYDVNSTDNFGATALLLFIWKVYHYKSRYEEIVKILKLFLYENPDTSLNTCIVEKAISYDKMRFPDEEDESDGDIDMEDNAQGIEQQGDRKERLRLLPLLYKAGFQIAQRERDSIELPSLFSRRVTYNIALNHPRSLKDIARIAIRVAYPGRNLHKIVNALILPTSVKDYILMKDLLSDE